MDLFQVIYDFVMHASQESGMMGMAIGAVCAAGCWAVARLFYGFLTGRNSAVVLSELGGLIINLISGAINNRGERGKWTFQQTSTDSYGTLMHTPTKFSVDFDFTTPWVNAPETFGVERTLPKRESRQIKKLAKQLRAAIVSDRDSTEKLSQSIAAFRLRDKLCGYCSAETPATAAEPLLCAKSHQ